MQVNTETNQNDLNIKRTCKPLNCFLNLFLLNCNKKTQMPCTNISFLITKCVFMILVLATLSISSLYWKIVYFYFKIDASIRITDAVQMIFDLCQYIVDLSFLFVYGREISYEYFKQYGKIDNIIDMNYHPEMSRRLIKLIIFFASIWITSSVCDFVAWQINYGWMAPFVFSITYVYLLIKILTTLDLISQVMDIEYRLRCIGDEMLTYYYTTDDTKTNAEDCALKFNWFYRSKKVEYVQRNRLKNGAADVNEEIKWLGKCYLLLIEQTAFINKMYGLRILLNSLSLLIDMVRFTNIAIRFLIGFQNASGILDYFPAVSSLMRLSTCVAVVTSLVDHCEKAYRERDRIICIVDYYLIMRDPNNDVRKPMYEFRDFVQSRPITFHTAYFFRFDYSLLVSMASVVVTYTIIILQS